MFRPAALALAGLLASGAAFAQSEQRPPPRTITLVGEGEVQAQPDIALMSFSVVTEARTAAEAFARQRERADAVVNAIKEAGIEERDIQTSNVSITPRVAHADGRAPRIEGYTARNGVEIRLRQIDRAGAVIDSLVRAGVNEIDGIAFDFSKRDALLDQARKAAAADARRKAELYAEALGVKIAKLLSLTEDSAPRPLHRQFQTMSRAEFKAPSTPINAGEQTLRTSISVVFEVE